MNATNTTNLNSINAYFLLLVFKIYFSFEMSLLYKFFVLVIILKIHPSEAGNIARLQNNKTNFQYLVKGGYRPREHVLAKYIVALRTPPATFICGGCIYSDREILTAAHCLLRNGKLIENISVVAGSVNRLELSSTAQIRYAKELRTHSGYSSTTHRADLGMITLDTPLKLDGKTVQSIELVNERLPSNTKCTAFGWGCLYNGGPLPLELVYVDLELKSHTHCYKQYRKFSSGMVCAQNPTDIDLGTCQGDSGGPLVCRNKLVGIVSWGNKWCLKPDVFVNLYHYRNWITRETAYRIEKSTSLILFALGIFMIMS